MTRLSRAPFPPKPFSAASRRARLGRCARTSSTTRPMARASAARVTACVGAALLVGHVTVGASAAPPAPPEAPRDGPWRQAARACRAARAAAAAAARARRGCRGARGGGRRRRRRRPPAPPAPRARATRRRAARARAPSASRRARDEALADALARARARGRQRRHHGRGAAIRDRPRHAPWCVRAARARRRPAFARTRSAGNTKLSSQQPPTPSALASLKVRAVRVRGGGRRRQGLRVIQGPRTDAATPRRRSRLRAAAARRDDATNYKSGGVAFANRAEIEPLCDASGAAQYMVGRRAEPRRSGMKLRPPILPSQVGRLTELGAPARFT